ncbi:MAG: hypothetical protein BJ554DRAFT_4127 [Olpidium bornovanus]|uniref:Anaphase-promoting complex subunit 1 N-terminal domain-containing protein n=1 Tax=Olpidium bornovanus TaxID=278681 RepID=A0A8H7ZNL6_9FUNG|nr:MAG: hypothetical protein BJ554DRAFT_4127 [Olpidium bornovanus]
MSLEVAVLGRFTPNGLDHARSHPDTARDFSSAVESPRQDVGATGRARPEHQLRHHQARLGLPADHKPYWLFPGGGPDRIECPSSGVPPTRRVTGPAFEEELFVAGSTVFWSRGRTFDKSFTVQQGRSAGNCPLPIVKAFFAWFPSADRCDVAEDWKGSCEFEGRARLNPLRNSHAEGFTTVRLHRVLCTFFGTRANLYYPDGRVHYVELPFFVQDAWPMRVGCLLRPVPSATAVWENIADRDWSALDSNYDEPIHAALYELGHPLQSARCLGVRCAAGPFTPDSAPKRTGSTWEPDQLETGELVSFQEDVIFVSDASTLTNIIVTLSRDGSLTCWTYEMPTLTELSAAGDFTIPSNNMVFDNCDNTADPGVSPLYDLSDRPRNKTVLAKLCSLPRRCRRFLPVALQSY